MADPVRLRVVFNRFPEIRRGMDAQVGRVVAKAAKDVEGHAKSRAPVDTGFLRNSIQADRKTEHHWEVTVGAHYGIYLEYGTRHMTARPYFEPAIERVRPGFLAAMRRLTV